VGIQLYHKVTTVRKTASYYGQRKRLKRLGAKRINTYLEGKHTHVKCYYKDKWFVAGADSYAEAAASLVRYIKRYKRK